VKGRQLVTSKKFWRRHFGVGFFIMMVSLDLLHGFGGKRFVVWGHRL